MLSSQISYKSIQTRLCTTIELLGYYGLAERGNRVLQAGLLPSRISWSWSLHSTPIGGRRCGGQTDRSVRPQLIIGPLRRVAPRSDSRLPQITGSGREREREDRKTKSRVKFKFYDPSHPNARSNPFRGCLLPLSKGLSLMPGHWPRTSCSPKCPGESPRHRPVVVKGLCWRQARSATAARKERSKSRRCLALHLQLCLPPILPSQSIQATIHDGSRTITHLQSLQCIDKE